MAGTITHSWNGTVLTVTSDSGTSSADLKGEKGDKGSRGPQGRAGVIVNADGTVDMSGYATETYVDEQITRVNTGGTIDLKNYATIKYVDEKVASAGGGTAESIAWDKVTGKPTFATVATSGSYNDLTDKPTIPQAYTLPEASSTTLGGVKVGSGLSITNGVLSATGSAVADSIDWSKVQNKPSFASVATSGDYNDLTNKPTIPQEYTLPAASESALGGIKVGSGLSITSDGVLSATGSSSGGSGEAVDLSNYYTKAETDSAIQTAIDGISTGTTVDLSNYYTKAETESTIDDKIAAIPATDLSGYALKTEIPTNVSELTNDSGYQTEAQVKSLLPTVPTKVSELENDAYYASKQYVDNAIPNVSNFITMAAVEEKGYQTADQVTALINNNPELPRVTANDNNKVLGVVNGAWAVMELNSLEEVSF